MLIFIKLHIFKKNDKILLFVSLLVFKKNMRGIPYKEHSPSREGLCHRYMRKKDWKLYCSNPIDMEPAMFAGMLSAAHVHRG